MENRNNAQFTYQATQISTATKEQLLLITYDIGIKSCRIAETALSGDEAKRDFEVASREIIRAQAVIRELMVTLNMERGGEMAKTLMGLYNFMYQTLVDANVSKEPEKVRTVRDMLESLKQSWEDALVKLLKEYQAQHPEDKDLKDALSELGDSGQPQSTTPQLKTTPMPQRKAKSGSLNLAG